MLRAVFLITALALAACIDTSGNPDAGGEGGAPCADPYDAVNGYEFECPLVLDDIHTMGLDPSMLPMGSAPCHAPQLAQVTRVVDGDTIRVDYVGGTRDVDIRMIGIDCPEVMHPPDPTPADCYGNEARDFSTTALTGHLVWLTYGESCLDPYMRTLAFVNLGPLPQDLYQRQLQRRGFSKTFTFSDNPDYASTFVEDANAAMAAHAGLYGACP